MFATSEIAKFNWPLNEIRKGWIIRDSSGTIMVGGKAGFSQAFENNSLGTVPLRTRHTAKRRSCRSLYRWQLYDGFAVLLPWLTLTIAAVKVGGRAVAGNIVSRGRDAFEVSDQNNRNRRSLFTKPSNLAIRKDANAE